MRIHVTWIAGLIVRRHVKNQIEKYLDHQKINYSFSYKLKEYRGLLESEYDLIVESPTPYILEIFKSDIQSYLKKVEYIMT